MKAQAFLLWKVLKINKAAAGLPPVESERGKKLNYTLKIN